MRLLRVRDVSQAHGKPIETKMPGSRKSDKMRKMSAELANLFQANGLEPYATVSPEGGQLYEWTILFTDRVSPEGGQLYEWTVLFTDHVTYHFLPQ